MDKLHIYIYIYIECLLTFSKLCFLFFLLMTIWQGRSWFGSTQPGSEWSSFALFILVLCMRIKDDLTYLSNIFKEKISSCTWVNMVVRSNLMLITIFYIYTAMTLIKNLKYHNHKFTSITQLHGILLFLVSSMHLILIMIHSWINAYDQQVRS